MTYSPHILEIKNDTVNTVVDGIPSFLEETYTEIAKCRCDDSGVNKQISVNGTMFAFSYHIVYVGERIEVGKYVRVMDKGNIRGEGEVIKSSKCNMLNYSEIWI